MIEKNFLQMISSGSKPQRSNRFRRIRDSTNNGIVLGTLVLLAVTLVIVSIFVSVFTSRPNIQHTEYYQEPVEEQLIVTVDITFDITNECGLNADTVMNGEKNTLKAGLTDALYEISTLSLHDEEANIKVSSVSIGRILDIESVVMRPRTVCYSCQLYHWCYKKEQEAVAMKSRIKSAIML